MKSFVEWLWASLSFKEVVSRDKTELDSKSVEESSISDKTKVSEEGSKTEEEPQKPVVYEFFGPEGFAKVNCKLKEKTKASEESSKCEEEFQKPVAFDYFAPKESAKVNYELKEKTVTSEECPKAEEEPQKPVAYENFEIKGSTKVNYKLKENTKASVSYEFFEPKESNSTKTLMYYKVNSKSKAKTNVYEESSKAEEEPQNHMAYEFFEPKESAPINSKLKANLRAKFEMNQINRGRIPVNIDIPVTL